MPGGSRVAASTTHRAAGAAATFPGTAARRRPRAADDSPGAAAPRACYRAGMPTIANPLLPAFARVALANVRAEYPFHLVHLARSDDEVRPPRLLHPVFFGAYDWHSCVHMHWTLLRCLRRAPAGEAAAAIAAHFDARLTAAAIDAECAYFAAAGRAAFERPYGWGWLLQLAAELDALAAVHAPARPWRVALAPLAALIAQRFVGWLPRADFPVRGGTHGNSAFALLLALNYARRCDDARLAEAIADRAQAWFGADRAYPAAYEPSGDDFLSPGLCEALLMARLLDAPRWTAWWTAFAPPEAALAAWLAPVPVADPTDPKIVHLHGLNLSRAWCWRQLRPHLPPTLRDAAERAAEAHWRASLAAATEGDYVGTHWLASFALLALDGDALDGC